NAYIGNSIGAIIAAFLAQGLEREIEKIAATIRLKSIVDVGPENEGLPAGQEMVSRIRKVSRSIAQKGGLDTAPLRSILEKWIDEKAVRARGFDLGMVTVNVSDLTPEEIFLDAMPPGSLVDYLMASSAVPGFALPRIQGKTYVDGGVYDNVPYETARRRGYRRIVVVDVSGAGISFKPEVEGSETVYIRNSIQMGGILDFDRTFLDRFKALGYLDTMRVFGRLHGYSYFLRPDPKAEARFLERVSGLGQPLAAEAARPSRGFFPDRMRLDGRLLLKCLECAAASLHVERIREYSYPELAAEIALRKAEEEERAARAIGSGEVRGAARLERLLVGAWKEGRFEAPPYFYHLLAQATRRGKARDAVCLLLTRIFPELRAAEAWFGLDARITAISNGATRKTFQKGP
ncbi:MAG TPA: patatin-like phospholipase family protein, partial [Magnetospirillaceae bacterium]|nr:patatin-like phospholipase family protein [Magnetospirillaceae bacterium]